ncbi:MAG: hypothetical protein U9R02_07355 [Thermodesulfobacteriota bacterium]|nr:hypothetical protein [Thermodesulfobacteriota bacterium]
MIEKVYVETSVIGAYFDERTDIVSSAQKYWTRIWWDELRARSKITSHFKRRCIPPGCVAKARNMPDIPALSRLASRAPQHLKLRTYF